jgi:hypothetical protein
MRQEKATPTCNAIVPVLGERERERERERRGGEVSSLFALDSVHNFYLLESVFYYLSFFMIMKCVSFLEARKLKRVRRTAR